jgi:hypothetical protein
MQLTLQTHKLLLQQQIRAIELKIKHCTNETQKKALRYRLDAKINAHNQLWRRYLLN